jgi:hypothetical protein
MSLALFKRMRKSFILVLVLGVATAVSTRAIDVTLDSSSYVWAHAADYDGSSTPAADQTDYLTAGWNNSSDTIYKAIPPGGAQASVESVWTLIRSSTAVFNLSSVMNADAGWYSVSAGYLSFTITDPVRLSIEGDVYLDANKADYNYNRYQLSDTSGTFAEEYLYTTGSFTPTSIELMPGSYVFYTDFSLYDSNGKGSGYANTKLTLSPVPEGGMTLILLGGAFSLIAGVRRFLRA